MTPSSPPKAPSELSDSLHHRLNMYALAASATGVGVLGLAQAAEARIVYTPAHHVIHRGSLFKLDLNHDGIQDFRIRHLSGCTTDGFCTTRLYATGAPYKGNNVVGAQHGFDFAYALKPGSRVGPVKPFLGHAMYYRFRSVNTYGHCTGPWTHVKNRYLGFKFVINGKIHYGWARLNVECTLSNKIGILTGYAYETIPNKPIIAGRTHGPDLVVEPPSLGRLAAGRK